MINLEIKSLDKKLLKDFWHILPQALAIALVISCGIGVFIMSLSTYRALMLTQNQYYHTQHFADIFASLKRAPNTLLPRIREIPGVKSAEGRIKAPANLLIPGFQDPVMGQLVSINEFDALNRPYLKKGRLINPTSPNATNEILLSESFALAHHYELGDTIQAIIKGHEKKLKIVGIAISPEYIYEIAPGGLFPDHQRYAIIWMDNTSLSHAYDMYGAFNDISLSLFKGTLEKDVLKRLDAILEPYGNLGSYARKDQLSHRFLSSEFDQLKIMTYVFPTIFFVVTSFLLNMVISRLISIQREQIGILKAFGYTGLQIGIHYFKLISLIILLGVIGGTILGMWLGNGLSHIYSDFYKFPYLIYPFQLDTIIKGALICFTIAWIGTSLALQQAIHLPPAVAMRPAPPVSYEESWIEGLAKKSRKKFKFKYKLPHTTHIILRSIHRRPFKSFFSILGIAFAFGTMMLGNFQKDSINYMVEVQFGLAQREDLKLSFNDVTSSRALASLRNLPGVHKVEGYRVVPIRLKFEQRSYLTILQGLDPHLELQRVLNTHLKPILLPPEGIVLTDYLGVILGLKIGNWVTVETLEGHRKIIHVPVVGLSKQYIGVSAFMSRTALNRLMQEGDVISGAVLTHDNTHQNELYSRFNKMPQVAFMSLRKAALKSFLATFADTVLIFTFISTMLGGALTFGVVYNNAHITLAERVRELMTLRVLGFTQQEIAHILFGEIILLTFIAIPLGFLVGTGLCAFLATNLESDLYRVPLVLTKQTYAFATLAVILSTAISLYFIWCSLKKINFIATLKTTE